MASAQEGDKHQHTYNQLILCAARPDVTLALPDILPSRVEHSLSLSLPSLPRCPHRPDSPSSLPLPSLLPRSLLTGRIEPPSLPLPSLLPRSLLTGRVEPLLPPLPSLPRSVLTGRVVVLDSQHAAAALFGVLADGGHVQGLHGERIEHSHVHTGAGQLLGGRQRVVQGDAGSDHQHLGTGEGVRSGDRGGQVW